MGKGRGVLLTKSNPKSLNLAKFSLGGGVLWTNSNPKFFNLAKFSFGGGTLDQVQPKVPSSLTIFFSGGGGGYSGHRIPKILEWGHSGNFESKILAAYLAFAWQSFIHYDVIISSNCFCALWKGWSITSIRTGIVRQLYVELMQIYGNCMCGGCMRYRSCTGLWKLPYLFSFPNC